MKRIETYVLPEYLCGALINGDCTGLTDDEVNELKDFLVSNPGYCVGCSEERFFTWHNDINNLGCTCLKYQFLIEY